MSASPLHREPEGLVVITGGAGGIGRALAGALVQRGRRVLIADIDVARLDEAEEELRTAGGDVYSHHVDVTDEASVAELVRRATSLGRVSLACLNVGVNSPGHVVWDTPVAVFDAIIDINLRGLFNSLRGFVPVLRANPEPAQIVVTASIGGLVSTPFAGVYSASKAGVIALVKTLREELVADAPQLGVVLLAPDMVQTDFILNSADVLGPTVVADPAITQAAHDYMSQRGMTATEAARWALNAIDKGDFWALPSTDEPSVVALRNELRLLDESM